MVIPLRLIATSCLVLIVLDGPPASADSTAWRAFAAQWKGRRVVLQMTMYDIQYTVRTRSVAA